MFQTNKKEIKSVLSVFIHEKFSCKLGSCQDDTDRYSEGKQCTDLPPHSCDRNC